MAVKLAELVKDAKGLQTVIEELTGMKISDMPVEIYHEYLKGYNHNDKTLAVWGVLGVTLYEEHSTPPELLYLGTKKQALDFMDIQEPDNEKNLFLIKMHKKVGRVGE